MRFFRLLLDQTKENQKPIEQVRFKLRFIVSFLLLKVDNVTSDVMQADTQNYSLPTGNNEQPPTLIDAQETLISNNDVR